MNAAAILREGLLFQKREEKELEKYVHLQLTISFYISNVMFLPYFRLEKLLDGAKDGSEFEAWQKEKLEKDRKDKEAEMERKRFEGKLSHEEAIIARQRQVKKNRNKVCTLLML